MLWYVVPLGVAAALSVFPILAVVLLLLSPNPIPASVGYPTVRPEVVEPS